MEKEHFMNNQKGVTLLEVLLSITILSIVILSFLSFFNLAYDYTKRNEDKTVGINVARNVLYYIEQLDYQSVSNEYPDLTKEDKSPEIKLTKESCNNPIFDNQDVCNDFFSTAINDKFHTTVTIMKPNDPQLQGYLFSVKVTSTWSNQTATVEGVIKK